MIFIYKWKLQWLPLGKDNVQVFIYCVDEKYDHKVAYTVIWLVH